MLEFPGFCYPTRSLVKFSRLMFFEKFWGWVLFFSALPLVRFLTVSLSACHICTLSSLIFLDSLRWSLFFPSFSSLDIIPIPKLPLCSGQGRIDFMSFTCRFGRSPWLCTSQCLSDVVVCVLDLSLAGLCSCQLFFRLFLPSYLTELSLFCVICARPPHDVRLTPAAFPSLSNQLSICCQRSPRLFQLMLQNS